MAKTKGKYVVAVKDTRTRGKILPGKILGIYRKEEFARKAKPSLLRTNNIAQYYHVGIFLDGKLID